MIPQARRPNVVMILTDDHAAHAIGAYGSVVNTTPCIDEIARRGWRFDNCFATSALCSPSRASILTGTYSHVNGVTTLVTPIDASQPTFPSLLRQAGYHDPAYREIRERLKRKMWRAQEALGDAPHPSQPRPAGV